MRQIFISYAHADASVVAELLYARLTGAGYAVWKDDHSLFLGRNFPSAIANAIGEHDYFLVLLSAAALQSDWVEDEINMATVARRPIIPIVLADLEIPLYLRRIHC